MEENELAYYLGGPDWIIPDWRGVFFTGKADADIFLEQYASVFNTVEVQQPETAIPEEMKRWMSATPEDFRFCVPLPPKIIQSFWALKQEKELFDFIDRFEPMASKIGMFLIALPEVFGPDYLPGLERLLQILPPFFSFAVEVRHPGFYDHGDAEYELVNLLSDNGINRVISDTRKLYSLKTHTKLISETREKYAPLPVRFEKLGKRPVVRYIGTDVINNEAYLAEWAIIAANWIKEGRKPIILFDAPDIKAVPAMATAFHNILSSFTKLKALPEWPVHRKSQLGLF